MSHAKTNPPVALSRQTCSPKVMMLASRLCKVRDQRDGCLAVALTPLSRGTSAPRLAADLGAALNTLQQSPVLVLSCAGTTPRRQESRTLPLADDPSLALQQACKLTEQETGAPLVRTSLNERVGSREVAEFMTRHFRSFMTEARTRFNFILIDTDHDAKDPTAALLPATACDAAIAVVTPGVTQVSKIREYRRTLESNGVQVLGFVLSA